MAVHIAPKVLHVRFYPDGVDVNQPLHAMRTPYLAHVLVMINDKGIGRVEWRHNDRERGLNLGVTK
jgi:hypothetical protein